MSKFQYRMQNILAIKEKMETQAKNEFAIASMRLDEEQEILNGLFGRKKDYETEAVNLLNAESLDFLKISENKNAIIRMEEMINKQILQVHVAERKLEQQRIKLAEVMKERKTQEVLRDRAFEEFLQEEKAAESKEIDQLTTYTYGQKRNRE